MKKKVLLVTTISGFVPQFEMNNVKILQEMGYEVHYATNYKTPTYTDSNKRLNHSGIIRHQVNFVRSPFYIKENIEAYLQLKKIMEEERFQLVHCHTPMGAVLARLAAKNTKTVPVIYTAHGFHFYKGAPFVNWLVFYPVEKWLARYTDGLITMNKEDYQRAKTFHLRTNGEVYFIHGIGMHLQQYKGNVQQDKSGRRLLAGMIKEKLGINSGKNLFILMSVGELSKRKNHSIVLDSMEQLQEEEIVYMICGKGKLADTLQHRIENSEYLRKHVILTGYRTDVKKLLREADCFVFPSLQEGLPVAVMEAMAMGLPVIASEIRGNVDLIVPKKGGYLVGKNDVNGYKDAIWKLKENEELRRKMGEFNQEKIQEFSIEEVEKVMREVYKRSEYK